MADFSKEKKAKVYLVGAGPGDPDLITVRAAQLLKTADCIILDKLANPDLLRYAKTDAEIIHTPKRVGPGSFNQQQINDLIIEKALAGKTVVRLKGGDPCIFARVSQEALALSQAGIDFEIVPGITAAVAVSSYSGILLTDRRYASQVVFVTGREAEDKQNSNIDWNLLAKCNGTIVFYMAVGNLDFIVEQLIKNGLSKKTPAAVIADVTLPTQKIVKSNIEKISDESKKQKIEPPAIIVVGIAAKGNENLNWFMNQPLFGKNIVLTRHKKGNLEFAEKIVRRAANPIIFHTFQIKPLTRSSQFLQALANLNRYHWIIFTSANGVDIFFDSIKKLGKDCRVFASAQIAAVGCRTAEKLKNYGLSPDFVPDSYTSEQLGKQLVSFANLKDKKILLLRSKLADNKLNRILALAGASLSETALYSIEPVESDAGALLEKITSNKVDWITFASPSSVRFFFEKISPDLVISHKVKIASIGPVTSQQLKNRGLKINIEAVSHTVDCLIESIESKYY